MPISEDRGGYGRFNYSEGSRGAIRIDPAWVDANIRPLALPQALALSWNKNKTVETMMVHRATLRHWTTLLRAWLCARVYPQSFAGSFVGRHMMHDARKPLSSHSWGIAADFDSDIYPYGCTGLGTIAEQRAVIAVQCGFKWLGGKRTRDPMHYEALTLRELLRIERPIKPMRLIVGKPFKMDDYLKGLGAVGEDGLSYKQIACTVENGRAIVSGRELGEWLGVPEKSKAREWFEIWLNNWGLRYSVDRTYVNDPVDPRAYVKVTY